MLKKAVILSSLLLIAMFTSALAYASVSSVDITVTEQFNTWSLVENSGVYMAVSNRVRNAASSITFEIWDYYTGSETPENEYYFLSNVFVNGYGLETSRVTEYSSETSTAQLATYDLGYDPSSFTTENLLTAIDESYDITSVSMDVGNWYNITLVLSEDLTTDQMQRIVDTFNGSVDDVYYYWGTIPAIYCDILATVDTYNIYLDTASDLLLLPETNGSIYDNYEGMAQLSSHTDGYDVELIMNYDSRYYIYGTFSEQTDMTLFDNDNLMYYFSYEDEHFIVINHGSDSMFDTINWKDQEYIPYTIWNLDTNELVTFDRFDVYLYLTLGDANHIIGYFYADTFVIDRLMSVTSTFEYRWDPLIGEPTEWTPYVTTLEDTEVVSGGIAWQYQAAIYSAAAATVSLAIPVVGFPLFLIGSTASMVFSYLSIEQLMDEQNIWVGSHNEIEQAVDLNLVKPALYSEINAGYEEAYNRTMDLTSYDLWRLDYGAFNKAFNSPDINTDSNTINIIELTYMTNGVVYTMDGDNLNLIADVDWSLDPDNDYSLPGIESPIDWYWFAGIGFIGLAIIQIIKMKDSTRNFLRWLLVIALLLIYLGVLVV